MKVHRYSQAENDALVAVHAKWPKLARAERHVKKHPAPSASTTHKNSGDKLGLDGVVKGYLAGVGQATTSEVAKVINRSVSGALSILNRMEREGVVHATGDFILTWRLVK